VAEREELRNEGRKKVRGTQNGRKGMKGGGI
jgi:hypothetical protein